MDFYGETLYGEVRTMNVAGLVGIVCDLMVKGANSHDKGET